MAKKFNRAYQHPLHSAWRIVAVALTVYTFIRGLVIIIFSTSPLQRQFASSIGPGFGDRRFMIFSCLGFAAVGVLMAGFIYHYMASLNPTQKTLRLSLWLSSAAISGYHVALSLGKFLYGMVVDNGLLHSSPYLPHGYEASLLAPSDTVPIAAAARYLTVNVLYISLTTLVLFASLQLVFWLSLRRQPPYTTAAVA